MRSRPNPTIAPSAAARATTSNEEVEPEWSPIFVGVEDLLVVEDEPVDDVSVVEEDEPLDNLLVVEDGLLDGAERDVEEVEATAARSPKVYHEAVSPKPAVFVVYTVCRVASEVQPNPENWRLPSHVRVAQESEPGTALPAIPQD